MNRQRRLLRDKAMRFGRISTVEQTLTTLAVVYATGTVDVYQWVAE